MTVQETSTTAIHSVTFSGVTMASLRVLLEISCCTLRDQKFPGIEEPVTGVILPPKWELSTKEAVVEVRTQSYPPGIYPEADLEPLHRLLGEGLTS